ncbi:hypothetical protein [Chitinophaga flava]|uniref:hypothetical protein n=1 Tax=Chitinophaga flava TaxID=2259036 RepID=UPI001292CE64|nr:hypothetical protein [Chitinophaga flava]
MYHINHAFDKHHKNALKEHLTLKDNLAGIEKKIEGLEEDTILQLGYDTFG